MKKEVKNYVGYVLGENVELRKFERQFLDLERERLDKVIPISDLRTFQEQGSVEVKVLEYAGIEEEIIFEGLKGTAIMFNFIENGDTYRDFFTKLSKNETLKRSYNLITKNVFDIYKKTINDLETMSLNLA